MRVDDTLIDEYLHALGRRLSGPGRLKADLLAEARDGLVDAAEAYQADGLTRRAAQARAVAEFGPIRRVSPDYQAELGVGAARRMAFQLATVPVTISSLSSLMWRGAPWTERATGPHHGYSLLARAVDGVGIVLAIVGLLAFLVLTVGARRWPLRQPAARAVALGGLVAVLTLYASGLSIYLMSLYEWGGALLAWTPTQLGGLVVLASYAWLGYTVRRCLAATRRTTLAT
jgi:hypothetical protein